jgi:integrase
MSRREGHITERSPGRWLIRYSVTEPGGRRRYAVTVKGTKRDAERELRQRLDAVDKGEHVDPTRMTVGVWLTHWLEIIRGDVSPATHANYNDLVRHYLVPALGGFPIAKLQRLHITNVYSAWVSDGRRDGKPGGLSSITRRHLHRVLHTALARAVAEKVVARHPDADRRLPKVERRELAVLSAEQSATLLEGIRRYRVYRPVLLALATGARRGEILALRWRHVDLDRGVISIVGAIEHTRAGIRFKAPKSGRARAVTIPGFALAELHRWRREQAEELLRLGVRLNADTLLCARADGEPMLPTSLTHEWNKVAGKIEGVPRVRFHDLRHSHATTLLASGVPLKVVSERLGHSTIMLTADTYAHVTAAMQEDAAQRLDAAFRGIIRPR